MFATYIFRFTGRKPYRSGLEDKEENVKKVVKREERARRRWRRRWWSMMTKDEKKEERIVGRSTHPLIEKRARAVRWKQREIERFKR